jgi:hypothetical protein
MIRLSTPILDVAKDIARVFLEQDARLVVLSVSKQHDVADRPYQDRAPDSNESPYTAKTPRDSRISEVRRDPCYTRD